MIELSVSLASNGVVSVPGYEQLLRFGYTKNRGVYRLKVSASGEWAGLTIRCFWHLPGSNDPASTLVVDGHADVPASVTAQAGGGCITFEGSDGTKTVTSADLRYRVGANSGTEDGSLPEPGTTAWEALVGTVKGEADKAQQAKTSAEGSAAQAKEAAGKAADSLQELKDGIASGNFKGETGPAGADGKDGKDGAPGKDATVDATLTRSGQAADAKVTGEELASLKSAVSAIALTATESGNLISVSDSMKAPLRALHLYGKSTQDGTPSIDSPVPIVNAGDKGTIKVTVCGKNLLSPKMYNGKSTLLGDSGVSATNNFDGTFILNGTATGQAGNIWYAGAYMVTQNTSNVILTLKKGYRYKIKDCHLFSYDNKTVESYYEITGAMTRDVHVTGVRCAVLEVGKDYTGVVQKPCVTIYPEDAEYAPYTGQTMALSTPDGLPGIAVKTGGNYTDETGQQWVCDEIDLERGKYVQRVKKISAEKESCISTNPWNTSVLEFVQPFRILDSKIKEGTKAVLSSVLPTIISPWETKAECIGPVGAELDFSISNDRLGTTKDSTQKEATVALGEFLKSNSIDVMYELATPIERDLTAEEISAYAALTSYPSVTTVMNDGDAGQSVTYQRDPNIVIKNIEDAIASMTK